MDDLKKQLGQLFDSKKKRVISEQNMRLVGEALRDILSEHGLGIGVMVAYLHGLKVGHIPIIKGDSDKVLRKQSETIHEKGKDDYIFAHIPVRGISSDKAELKKRGIMNEKADPIEYIYHEDGLIGVFSFDLEKMNQECGESFDEKDILTILINLGVVGILIPTNVNNRQIQFKDNEAKTIIEKSREKIYVKSDRSLNENALFLPKKYNSPKVKNFILNVIRYKGPCNYCSVKALNPLEATIHSTPPNETEPEGQLRATVRNYQFGFTFAPFGDPNDVCHFLAWDFPHIHEQVKNMDPQWYSFSDLIKLVTIINRDIAKFCEAYRMKKLPSIKGVCNHWAGNSIYHQHFQFFNLPEIPVLGRQPVKDVAKIEGIVVRRLDWPMPVYEISSSIEHSDQIMSVADSVARIWEFINKGYDLSYGNGIRIKNYTQNIFVTQEKGSIRAFFIPRHRNKISATWYSTDGKVNIKKKNIGVLETLGYFVIDSSGDFEALNRMGPTDRNNCGEFLLSKIAPFQESDEFESKLSGLVSPELEQFNHRLNDAINDGVEILRLMNEIRASSLFPEQQLYLLSKGNDHLKIVSPDNTYDKQTLQDMVG